MFARDTAQSRSPNRARAWSARANFAEDERRSLAHCAFDALQTRFRRHVEAQPYVVRDVGAGLTSATSTSAIWLGRKTPSLANSRREVAASNAGCESTSQKMSPSGVSPSSRVCRLAPMRISLRSGYGERTCARSVSRRLAYASSVPRSAVSPSSGRRDVRSKIRSSSSAGSMRTCNTASEAAARPVVGNGDDGFDFAAGLHRCAAYALQHVAAGGQCWLGSDEDARLPERRESRFRAPAPTREPRRPCSAVAVGKRCGDRRFGA